MYQKLATVRVHEEAGGGGVETFERMARDVSSARGDRNKTRERREVVENPLIRRVFSLRYEMEHVSPLDRRQRLVETRGYVVPFENVVQTRGRGKRRGSLFEIVRIIIIARCV